jgi:phosphoribosylcarboxyaminoimidazole (NCAIR) mutase
MEVISISASRSDKDQRGATASTEFASRTLTNTNVSLASDIAAEHRSFRPTAASARTDNGLDYAVLAACAGMIHY